MQDGDGGMADAIEHIGLDGGVVEHILKDDVLAHLQSMVEPPKTHEITRETTVSANAIDMFHGRWKMEDGRLVVIRTIIGQW